MQAIEGLFRRIRQKAESIPPSPQPEIINEEIHPLHFYPGFKEFAARWNNHAASPTRLGLQATIQTTQRELDGLSSQTGPLQLEVERLKEEQQRQQEIFDAKQNVPKREKFAPLKSANRRWRRAWEDLDRIVQQEKPIRQPLGARLEVARVSLVDLDDEFAFSLEEDAIGFYVAERLRKDPEAIDAFLLRYCAKKGLSGYELKSELRSINCDFFALLRYYTNSVKEVGHEELWANAGEATNRQLRKLAPKSVMVSTR